MPRRNRNRREVPRGNVGRSLDSGPRTESFGGRSFVVRPVRGNAENRSYVCPGCQQQLSSGVAHVVVWPDDGLGDVQDRRHWHTGCWTARERRPPRGSFR